MRWKKLGVVWKPDGSLPWARSHAAGPTPLLLDNGVLRVYVTCQDDQGRGRPTWVDLDPRDPTRVLGQGERPLLDIGRPGAFDDNGLMVCSAVSPAPGVHYLYYAGFELCRHVRYRILTGLAVSTDHGRTFQRQSETPLLERGDGELYFRCGPFVLQDEGRFKLWYVAGDEWTQVDGKAVPVYHLHYLESADGRVFGPRGRLTLKTDGEDEHGVGRPWVVKKGPRDYELYYSIRRRSLKAYRLGFARSTDGVAWRRDDAAMGLDVSPGAFDGEAIMFSAVISVGGRTWCFYNGDGFGQGGFGVAVRE